MSGPRFAIMDPAAGISGDMLLGALVDAGAPPDWLPGLPARLGIPDTTVEIETALRCGVRAAKVTVRAPGGAVELPGDFHAPARILATVVSGNGILAAGATARMPFPLTTVAR